MKPQLAALVLTACLASGVTAQNLLTNGDFAKVNANGTPSGWTVQKFDIAPAVKVSNTDGANFNNAFSVVHGAASNTGNANGELIQNNILIVGGTTHELRADIAVAGSFNNDPGVFEFFVGGVSVAKLDLMSSRGSKPANVTFRERVCVQFQPKTTGQQQVKVTIGRRFLAALNRTPTAFLDNVFLGRTSGPAVCPRGERIAGTTVTLEVVGRPNMTFGIFASAKLLATPVVIPGWSGRLELQPPVIPLLITKTDATGRFKISAPTNTADKGLQVYLQGAQAASSTSVDLGYAQLINLY
jgi:hypothetical protein